MRREAVIAIIAIGIVLIFAFYITLFSAPGTVCTQEVRICPDGTGVGRNPINDCEFDPCPSPSDAAVYCTPLMRQIEVCTAIYQPVCGWFDPDQVQCIKYPCAQTYGNACGACTNPQVLYYTEGECPL